MDRELAEKRIRAAMTYAATHDMQWGVDNCAFWCADILTPLIGVDLMKDYRGRFRSQSGAYRLMGKGGLRKNIERMAIERSWSWVPPDRAQVGDIGIAKAAVRLVHRYVFVKEEDGLKRRRMSLHIPALSTVICVSPGWFVGRCDCGWATRPASKVDQAWSVK